MPRLRNAVTGVVMSVDSQTAARMGGGWESAGDGSPEPKRKAAQKGRTRSTKTATKDESDDSTVDADE